MSLLDTSLILKKYQPKRFNDFIIHKQYISMFENFIEMDRLNILLIGNSGSGKTTIIESIIKEYYNLDIVPSENLLYINSLQDQGIQYYRNDVKQFCQTKGSIKHKKKFVILDNLDTVNEQSQQVFRNYIDKYSHNIYFIASCTYKQKVIDALQSRLTLLKLPDITMSDLSDIFDHIKAKEQLNITNNSKKELLNICDYSIRKLLSYIEKFKLLNKKVYVKNVKAICNNISFYDFELYTEALLRKDLNSAKQIIYSLYDRGYSVIDIFDNYFTYIKYDINLIELQKFKLIKLICKYISIFHTIHEHQIELILFTNNAIEIL